MSEFEGSITKGSITLTVIPSNKNITIGRVLVSIPINCDDSTLNAIKSSVIMAANTGPNLSNTALCYSVYRNVLEMVDPNIGAAKVNGYLNSSCYATPGHFNIVVNYNGQAMKVLSGIKSIARGLVPNKTIWRGAFESIVDKDNKPIKPDPNDFENSCHQFERGLKKLEILCTGKILVRDTKESAKAKIVKKIEAANNSLKFTNCGKHKTVEHEYIDRTNFKYVKPLNSHTDYFWCDYHSKNIVIINGHAYSNRELSISDNQIDSYVRASHKTGDLISEMAAFHASNLGAFDATTLKKFTTNITEAMIKKALK